MTQTLKYYDNVYIFSLTQILCNHLMPVHVYILLGYMDWIGLAQGTDRWRTLVGSVMNIRVP